MARRSGQIIRRGDNCFLVRVFLGTDTTGKRHYFNRTVRGIKKDADKVLANLIRRREHGEPLEDSKHTFQAFAEDWLTVKANAVREGTIANYRAILSRYAFPRFGSRKLTGLDESELTNLYAGMTRQGLSGKTIRLLHAVLHSIFKAALKQNLIRTNPADKADKPKMERKEMKTFSVSQARAFLRAAQGTEEACLFNFLFTTGCRPSEALGLKWSDVNFDLATTTIQRTLKMKHGVWKFDPPKTAAGLRTIVLPTAMLTLLKDHKRKQNEARLKAGSEWKREDMIFCNRFGQPLGIDAVRKKFKGLLKEVGLPDFRLYDGRHTSATLLMASGINPKVVSERLGHSNIAITLGTYSHVTQQLQKEASDKLGEALFG